MKIAIVYKSKTGATAMCAKYIENALGECCDVLDIGKADVRAYEAIIVGSGVRMGKSYGKVRRFFRKNADLLADKYVALFLSHYAPRVEQKTVENCVTPPLFGRVRIVSCGGIQPFGKPADDNWMKKENIDEFIAELSSRAR